MNVKSAKTRWTSTVSVPEMAPKQSILYPWVHIHRDRGSTRCQFSSELERFSIAISEEQSSRLKDGFKRVMSREAILDSHPLNLIRCSHAPDILRFSGLHTRVSGQLNPGIVIMKGRQSILIFRQQWKDESEMMKHACVQPLAWMAGYDLMRQFV